MVWLGIVVFDLVGVCDCLEFSFDDVLYFLLIWFDVGEVVCVFNFFFGWVLVDLLLIVVGFELLVFGVIGKGWVKVE